MTEEELAMQLAEIRKPFWSWERWSEHSKNGFRRQARWHISELKKAELRASIGEVQSAIQMTLDFKTKGLLVNRLKKLQSELCKMEEGR